MPCARAFLLCLIGFILDGRIQFIRVLQQIAIGYLIVFPFVPLGPWVQAIVAIFLLGGHTAAYHDPRQRPGHRSLAAPDAAPPEYQNFGMWIDAWLRDHFFIKPPAGNYVQFNAISSAATIMFGVLAGELLRSGAVGMPRSCSILTLRRSRRARRGLGPVRRRCLDAGLVPAGRADDQAALDQLVRDLRRRLDVSDAGRSSI